MKSKAFSVTGSGTGPVSFSYSIEDVPLGTAGSVRKACEMLGRERVIVISGDALTDIDLDEVIRFHELNQPWLPFDSTRVPNPLEVRASLCLIEEGESGDFWRASWGRFSATL